MLFSLAIIIISGLAVGGILKKIGLPGLIGMLLSGIVLGPYALNLISSDLLGISAELRQIALIVILIRAGLALDINDLKKVGRPAVLMCFVPATFEIAATIVLAPLLFNISYIEAAIMGTVLGAVSPAVIVPKMLELMENGYGKNKKIPQLIMAAASVDDIYVIVLFTSFMSLSGGGSFNAGSLAALPVSIILGLPLGIVSGIVLVKIFKKLHMRDTLKVLILLSVSFLFTALEAGVKAYVPISGLLAVIALGATVLKQSEVLAKRISQKFAKVWLAAEIMLFALVGMEVDSSYALKAGFTALLLIMFALVIRAVGVFVCLLKTQLNVKERLFCVVSYTPKATVQAAIGGLPLMAGISAGNTILTVAVLSILLTAPLGAVAINAIYKNTLIGDK